MVLLHYKCFSFRNFLQAFLSFLRKPCTLLVQNITVLRLTYKYWSAKDALTKLVPYIGGGSDDVKLMPVLTNMRSTPDELLKMIQCSCRTDCYIYSMRCTCRKYILKCSPAYSTCKGSTCANYGTFLIENEDEVHVENDEL